MDNLQALLEKAATDFQRRHEIIGKFSVSEITKMLSSEEQAWLAEGLASGSWKFHGRLLHSARDAQREAERAAQAFGAPRALIAVSCGAGWLMRSLPASVRSVLLVEPSPYVTAAFLLSRHFEKFTGKISLFADRLEGPDALEEVLPWLQGKNLKTTLIYAHAAARTAAPALYTRAYERISALFEKRSVNQATIIKFQRLWNKNIFLNQRVIWQSGTLNDLFALRPPSAIVLAGAGPSLHNSMDALRDYRRHFVLFAADTALVPLNRAGIYPDVVFAADPQWLNHHFAESPAAARSAWLLDPVVCPAIPHRLSELGASMGFWNNAFAADVLFRTHDRGDLAHGGSVSTNAFDVAVRWLARAEQPARLILVGQDLSFSNKQAHCSGAVLESAVFNRANRLATMELHNLRQMRAMPVLLQKGILQEQVRTNAKLRIFQDWFEARAAETEKSKLRLINATHDGVRLRGFEHLRLDAALDGVEPGEFPDRWLNRAADAGSEERALHLLKGLAQVQRLVAENARLAVQKNPPPAVIARLNENDAELRKTGIAREIVGLNAQALILRITEQGEEPDAAQFYRTLEQAAREVRHWARRMHANLA